MQTLVASLTIGVLLWAFTVALAAPGGTEDKKEWMEQMKKCGDGEFNVKEAFKGMEKCKPEETKATDADPASKEKKMQKKNMCAAVCTWKEQGILDASGKFVENGCKEHVDKVYPGKYRSDALTNIKECATNSSSTFSIDDNCSGYKEFGHCTFGAHMKTCGIKWEKKPHGDEK